MWNLANVLILSLSFHLFSLIFHSFFQTPSALSHTHSEICFYHQKIRNKNLSIGGVQVIWHKQAANGRVNSRRCEATLMMPRGDPPRRRLDCLKWSLLISAWLSKQTLEFSLADRWRAVRLSSSGADEKKRSCRWCRGDAVRNPNVSKQQRSSANGLVRKLKKHQHRFVLEAGSGVAASSWPCWPVT